MTAKQAILHYLRTHRTFSAADVAAACKISQTGVNQAARILEKQGVVVVDSKEWRAVHYRLITRDEQSGKRSTNLIFQECRQSEVMKRVLAFYGRVLA